MAYVLMVLCVITNAVQSSFIKLFQAKCNKGTITFGAMYSFVAMLFFVASAIGDPVEWGVVPYSALFALAYAGSTVTLILALGCGSMAMSALIISYSLLIPTVYGLLFWNESVSSVQVIGIVALLISLFLIREASTEEKKPITLRWVLYITLAALTNGMCSIVQRTQQIVYGNCDTFFMAVSLAMVVLLLGVFAFWKEGKDWKEIFRKGTVYSSCCGLLNGATNLLVMLCLVTIPASIFFPVLSAGGLVISFGISVLLFRERFLKRQLLGLALGLLALILMNI